MNASIKNLSACTTLFLLFGYQFFSVKSLVKKNESKFAYFWRSIHFVLEFAVIISLSLINAAISVEVDVQEKLSAKTALSFSIQYLYQVGLTLIHCVCLVQSFASTKQTKQFFLNTFKITNIFHHDSNHIMNHAKVKRKLFLSFFATNCFIASRIIYLRFFEQNESFILRGILRFAVSILLSVVILKIKFYVNLINYHLESVFMSFDEMSVVSSPKVKDLYFYIKPVRSYKKADISGTIQSLRKVYSIILENSEIVNSSLGLSILTTMTTIIVFTTASIYRIFLIIDGQIPIHHIGGESLK
jgi:hypothetical protein